MLPNVKDGPSPLSEPAEKGASHTRDNGPVTPLFQLTMRRRIHVHRHDVAGPGFAVEIQFDTASVELIQHRLDPPLDQRMVRAVAGDKFLDNGPQRRG